MPSAPSLPAIESLSAAALVKHLPGLTALLCDAVASGASVGFLPPLATTDAAAYWDSVATALADGSRRLLIARDAGGTTVGTVQLDLVMRDNGRHRAEIAKLMVLRSSRRQGIGRALMVAVEAEARRLGRTTLVLDTRRGDPSETLYAALGYTLAGTIPHYARSASGQLDGTAIYYRVLD
ncbi:MAG: GNAT family N-acetyltransferase [Chloroflexi bacterium]|nr:GNAT family N-acetyltransferase [Chloroflexota bacterium]